jgi:hypothetical protein
VNDAAAAAALSNCTLQCEPVRILLLLLCTSMLRLHAHCELHCSTLLTACIRFLLYSSMQFLRPAANTACAVASCAFARAKGLLVIGFTTGVFGLYEMPSGAVVHTLSVGQKGISSAAIAPQGEWLAFGCAAFGQLLVWEWQVLHCIYIYTFNICVKHIYVMCRTMSCRCSITSEH